MDETYIAETIELAVAVAARIEDIDNHIEEHDIHDLWEQATAAIRDEHGLKPGDESYFSHPARLSKNIDYEMRLDTDGLYFSGYDRDNDQHGFTIPYGFLIPETRDASLDTYRARCARLRAERDEKAARAAEQQRVKDAAEYERLGKALGRH